MPFAPLPASLAPHPLAIFMRRSTARPFLPLRFLLVVVAFAAGGCDRAARGEAEPPPESRAAAVPVRTFASLPAGVTPAMVVEGEQLFGTACIACHGPEAGGTQLAPSLRDDAWINVDGSYDEIVALVRDGVADPEEYPVPMPPRGGGAFDEAQLRALGAYVATLSEPAPATE